MAATAHPIPPADRLRPVDRPVGTRTGRRPGAAHVVRSVGAVVVGLAFVAPLLWTLLTSVSRTSDVFQFPPQLLRHLEFGNYLRAWSARPWPRYFANTILIAGSVVALVLATSLLAGFAFAVMRFRGRSALFWIVMAVMMVPQTVLLIPNFIIAQRLHLYDTYLIQILPWGASVFGIFLLRQFFATLPVELFEAAEMDGAGPVRILFSVAAPLARPTMVLIALNAFMGSWNAFIWPYLMTKSDSIRPIEVGLQSFYGAEGTDWTAMCAAIVFTTVPVIALFLALQRYFVSGAYGVEGAVRG